MRETLLCGVPASMGGGWELVQRLSDGAGKRWRARNATGREGARIRQESRDDGTGLRNRRRPRNGWFGLTILAALALTAACTANGQDYRGKQALKQDGWNQLNVLALSMNPRCMPEKVLGEQIEMRFAPTHITPLISLDEDYTVDDQFLHEKWHGHIQDDLYLRVVMSCMPEIGDWGVVLGFVVHTRAEWYQYDQNTGSFRSWGAGSVAFGDTGVISIGLLAMDYLTAVMAETLDDYLEANLGTKEAVIAHRGDYPREKKLTEAWGPIGAKDPR